MYALNDLQCFAPTLYVSFLFGAIKFDISQNCILHRILDSPVLIEGALPIVVGKYIKKNAAVKPATSRVHARPIALNAYTNPTAIRAPVNLSMVDSSL
jgi:hypothetical protein